MYVDIRRDKKIRASAKRERNLSSKNAKRAKQFLDKVEEEFKRLKIQDHISTIKNDLPMLSDDQLKKKLDYVDASITKILRKADNSLTQKKYDYFTPKLESLRKLRSYWIKLNRGLHSRYTHEYLRNLNPRHENENLLLRNSAIRLHLRKVGSEIEEEELKAYERRQEHLTTISSKRQKDGLPTAKSTNAIKREEAQQEAFAQLRSLKSQVRDNVTPLQVPPGVDVEELWERIKVQEEKISQCQDVDDAKSKQSYLIQWSAKHYSQAKNTPFATGSLAELINPDTSNEIDNLLEGTLDLPNEVSQEVINFLAAMASPSQTIPNTERTELKYEDFVSFFRKAKEKKLTSPSGRHLGIMKVCSESNIVMPSIFSVLEMAISRNIILERWTHTSLLLLRKDKNAAHLDRFRHITIIESDLQWVMTIIWAKSMSNKCHNEQSLQKNQYARKQSSTQESILNKRVWLDLQRLSGTEGMLFDYDATACYDRILPNFASYASRRLGLHPSDCVFIPKLLHSLKHHVVIDGLPTKSFFSHLQPHPTYGSGQGTGWSPFLWTAIDDIILTAMGKTHPGLSFLSPDGKTRTTNTILAYVDDTIGGVNVLGQWLHDTTRDSLTDLSTKIMQSYETYLSLSGGQVNLSKTFVYHLVPNYSTPLPSFLPNSLYQPTLRRSSDDRLFAIPQHPTTAPHRFLGVYLCPDGNNARQIVHMKDKVRHWIDNVGTSNYSPWKIRLSFERQLTPAIIYPLSTIHLSEKECDAIFDPLLPTLKCIHGMHRNYPTDLLHLPKKYGGHGIPNLYLLHKAKRLKLLFSSIHRQTDCGLNLKILIETQQLEAGVRKSILKLHNAKVRRYLSVTWLTHLLASIHDLGFSVKYDHWVPSQTQETIMDKILHFNLPVHSLIIFNKVRLSFKLLYCYDAYSLTGRHLLPFDDANLIPRKSHL